MDSASAAPAASTRPGMGAIPFHHADGTQAGTTFRVWAPFASQLHVAGDFNQWSQTAHPLASEGNGFWSADVAEALIGNTYRYLLAGPYIDGVQWRTDPYCKYVRDNDRGDGVIVGDTFDWGDDTFTMPTWNELVIYEIHVASFNRSPDKPGDFASITAKLGYLSDLGINAIQIMPIFGVPGAFSLGYNPALPFDIESSYGHPEDFKAFVKAAHAHGIAIILDVVYNHFGPQDLDTSLWTLDGWSVNGKGGIYFYSDDRSWTPWGSNNRPDYGRGEVRQFLRDNMLMWLEEYRADGLRFDSTVNIRNTYGNNNDPAHDLPDGWSLLQWFNNETDSRTPWKLMIAEDLQSNPWITRPTGYGGAGFDSQWDGYYYYAMFDAITSPYDQYRDMFAVRDILNHRFDADAWKRVIYSENHDEVAALNQKHRLPEVISPGDAAGWFARKRSTLAAALTLTAPGIPMLFQGQEFLEWGSWSDSGDLDWDHYTQFRGIWDLYQALIRLRRNWNDNTRGLRGQNINVFHVNNTDKLIAFQRWENGGPGDDVIVVLNFADRTYESYALGFPLEGTWYVRFNSDWQGFSPDFGGAPGYDTIASGDSGPRDGMPFSGNIGIGPYTALILPQ